MSLLDITGLSHSYGDSRLYSDSDLSLNRGEHMGIVGQNGTGKSTLIKICTELVIPDSGRVAWQPGITIGYLDQYACTNHVLTMEQFLKSSFRSLYELEAKINRLYDEAALSCNMEVLNQASLFQDQLERSGFYSMNQLISLTRNMWNGWAVIFRRLKMPLWLSHMTAHFWSGYAHVSAI